MESDPVQKLIWRFLNLKKNVIEREPKSSNFGRTRFKPLPKETSHKFLNVKIWSQVLSKRKKGTTLVFTSVGEELVETIQNWNQHSSLKIQIQIIAQHSSLRLT
jgi:hypothetical protein